MSDRLRADVVVVGGGPAGAAAIRALARAPVSVIWVVGAGHADAALAPVETLDAGAMTLIETQFGIAHHACGAHSYPRSPDPTPSAGRGGFHVRRPVLDRLLRNAVMGCSQARVIMGSARKARRKVDRSLEIDVEGDSCVTGRFVIDAAGRRHFLARQLRTDIRRVTPPLLLARSVSPVSSGAAPVFSGHAFGWLWQANEAADRSTWNVLAGARHPLRRAAFSDAGSASRAAAAPIEYIDATWRIVRPAASETYALAGEAAMVVDPASGDGIETALRLGDAAGRLAVTCLAHAAAAPFAAARYDDTVRRAFSLRAEELRHRYDAMGIDLGARGERSA